MNTTSGRSAKSDVISGQRSIQGAEEQRHAGATQSFRDENSLSTTAAALSARSDDDQLDRRASTARAWAPASLRERRYRHDEILELGARRMARRRRHEADERLLTAPSPSRM